MVLYLVWQLVRLTRVLDWNRYFLYTVILNQLLPFLLHTARDWLPWIPDASPLLTSAHSNAWQISALYGWLLVSPRSVPLFLWYWDPDCLQQLTAYFQADPGRAPFWLCWMVMPHVTCLYMAVALSKAMVGYPRQNLYLLLFVTNAVVQQIIEINKIRKKLRTGRLWKGPWYMSLLGQLFTRLYELVTYAGIRHLLSPFHYVPYLCILCVPWLRMLSTLRFLHTLFLCVIDIRGERQADIPFLCQKFVAGWTGKEAPVNEYVEWVGQVANRCNYLWTGALPRQDSLPAEFSVELSDEQEAALPNHLVCGICKGFLMIPMVTPAGNSYCRSCLQTLTQQEFRRVLDPVSKTPVNDFSLYFNRGLYVAGLQWLDSHTIPYTLFSRVHDTTIGALVTRSHTVHVKERRKSM